MIAKVVELLIACRHRHISRPITPVYRYCTQPSYSYVACLECGKQFYYDTTNLRMGPPIPQSLMTPRQASPKFRAQY
jgi:hypothetical protein